MLRVARGSCTCACTTCPHAPAAPGAPGLRAQTDPNRVEAGTIQLRQSMHLPVQCPAVQQVIHPPPDSAHKPSLA